MCIEKPSKHACAYAFEYFLLKLLNAGAIFCFYEWTFTYSEKIDLQANVEEKLLIHKKKFEKVIYYNA